VCLLSVLTVACANDGDSIKETSASPVSFPPASAACEAAVAQILSRWQATIDQYVEVDVEEFLAGERIYNLTEVPVGAGDCDPLTSTTLATDRAGTLGTSSATAAFAKGIILSDVAEMAVFGPGLDLGAPIAASPTGSPPDKAALDAIAPGADASCSERSTALVVALQAIIDAAAAYGTDYFTQPDELAADANLTAIGGLAERIQADTDAAGCDRAEQALALAGRWDELTAHGLVANVVLGSLTDTYYDNMHDTVATS
jgi:hypothetical protein